MYINKYIEEMTASAGLRDFKNVFTLNGLKLETPFIDAAEVCIRGFLFRGACSKAGELVSKTDWVGSIPTVSAKISGFKRSFPDSRKVDKRIENKKHALSAPDNMHHNKHEGPGWKLGSTPRADGFRDIGVEGFESFPPHQYGKLKRVMIFFATCEQLRGSRRLIVGTGNISTLNALHGQ